MGKRNKYIARVCNRNLFRCVITREEIRSIDMLRTYAVIRFFRRGVIRRKKEKNDKKTNL